MISGPVFVGTDLSPSSEDALTQGARLAADLGAALIVGHVLPEFLQISMLFPQWRGMDPAFEGTIRSKAEQAVRRHVEVVLGDAGRDVQIALDSGTPHTGLLAGADEARAGVIVIGPGRVAGDMARYATVPVLVARPSPGTGAVVGATDFSDRSLPALSAAASEARRRQAPLHFVYALNEGAFTLGSGRATTMPYLEGTPGVAVDGLDELRAAAERRLQDSLDQYGVSGQAIVVPGRAAEAIVTWAESAGAQLVVVGTHGRSGLARMALGSTASAVIDHAPCSVLVVRLSGA
jgi:nucleotide-binding universal stress UspA family protein